MSHDLKQTAQAHRQLAAASNGEVWRLLAEPARTPESDERMLAAAFACLYHWLHAGAVVHRQRGVWLISRVYTVLGNEREALAYAQRCLALTEAARGEMADFDLAYAYEGMARALALSGRLAEAQRYHAQAQEAGAAIADDEDRTIFQGDLTGGDWYGLG